MVPLTPGAVTKGSGSTASSLVLEWSALTGTNTGGSSITSYILYWDNGSGGKTSTILMNSLALTYTVTGLTAGSSYKFSVLGVNIHDPGAKSTDATLIPTDVPN